MYYTDINDNNNITPEETKNTKAVANSIRNIMSTKPGTVPGHPLFGCNLDQYIFELINPLTVKLIKNEIIYAINMWEPRIEISEIEVIEDTDYNRLKIYVRYIIKNDVNSSDHEYIYQVTK